MKILHSCQGMVNWLDHGPYTSLKTRYHGIFHVFLVSNNKIYIFNKANINFSLSSKMQLLLPNTHFFERVIQRAQQSNKNTYSLISLKQFLSFMTFSFFFKQMCEFSMFVTLFFMEIGQKSRIPVFFMVLNFIGNSQLFPIFLKV